MSASHPYISGFKNISLIVYQLRDNFPTIVDAETVKKLRLAPNNESYVINALQFVGVLDDESKKTEKAKSIFSKHKDKDFQEAFSGLIRESYGGLFDLYGDKAWTSTKDDLIAFFRQTDETSAVIGARQAGTFLVFAALSGYGELPNQKMNSDIAFSKKKPVEKKKKSSSDLKSTRQKKTTVNIATKTEPNPLALTVRVEINLPSDGSKETYDSIFKSIKENLLNGQ